jgi:hypothetical protein
LDSPIAATIHDANHATLNGGKLWRAWCCCGWNGSDGPFGNPMFETALMAMHAVHSHLKAIDPERARTYALEKGLEP